MPFPHVTAPHPRKEVDAQTKPSPAALPEKDIKLPESYFQDLLQLPSCKINGHCDRCGRCEH